MAGELSIVQLLKMLVWRVLSAPTTRRLALLVALWALLKRTLLKAQAKKLGSKLVLLTGAAGGLGKEQAMLFAKRGCRVRRRR